MGISFSEAVEVSCAHCGESFVEQAWRVVDAGERPDLRLLILMGRLNVACCPACGVEGPLPVPLLYHDAAHEAMLLALPAGVLAEAAIHPLADPLVEALHRAIPPGQRRPYLLNLQLAGSMAGLAAEISSWGGQALGMGGAGGSS